jgi:hypothetical protein
MNEDSTRSAQDLIDQAATIGFSRIQLKAIIELFGDWSCDEVMDVYDEIVHPHTN